MMEENRKFDFKCIFYTDQLMDLFREDDDSDKEILPHLRYVLLQLSQNAYDASGQYALTEEQINLAIEKSRELVVQKVLTDLQKEGLVNYVGITEDGDDIIQITELGKKMNEKYNKFLDKLSSDEDDEISNEPNNND